MMKRFGYFLIFASIIFCFLVLSTSAIIENQNKSQLDRTFTEQTYSSDDESSYTPRYSEKIRERSTALGILQTKRSDQIHERKTAQETHQDILNNFKIRFSGQSDSLSIAANQSLSASDDIIVGSLSYRAYVFDGSTGALTHTLEGLDPKTGSGFGNSVSSCDVNNDGKDDFIVGDRGTMYQGRAYVFNGSTGAFIHTLDTPYNSQNYGGFSVTIDSGDVNNDGKDEIIMGYPPETVGSNFAQGRVYVFDGSTGALIRTLDSPNPQSTVGFGFSVSSGDVNNDGRDDIVVGCPYETIGSNTYQGRAYVFDGSTGALIRILDTPNPQSYSEFGYSVDSGDVNSDGKNDIIVGAFGESVGANYGQGRAYVFDGFTGALIRTLNTPNPQSDAKFGRPISSGDVNNDGKDEIIVGAWSEDIGTNIDQGRAYVFDGSTGALIHTLDCPNPQSYAKFCWSVSSGDVNNDGKDDIIVGTNGQGQTYIFDGSTGALIRTLESPNSQSDENFGFSVCAIRNNPTSVSSLGILVSPTKNIANSGETVPVHISVTSDSVPVDADVEIRINKEIVASYTGSEYTYNFPSLPMQTSVGSYNIEATAKYNGLIARDVKKIEVIGDLSRVLNLVYNLKSQAHAEIYQSEDLAVSRLIRAEIDLGAKGIEIFFSEVIKGKVSEIVTNVIPQDRLTELGVQITNLEKIFLHPLKKMVNYSSQTLGNIIYESIIKNIHISALEDNTGIANDKKKIDSAANDLESYIKEHPSNFTHSEINYEEIFHLCSLKLPYITETTAIFPKNCGIPSTEPEIASYYDVVDKMGRIFSDFLFYSLFVLLVVILILLVMAVPITAPAILMPIGAAASQIGTVISIGGIGAKFLIAFMLMMSVPTISNLVEDQHENSIGQIIEAVEAPNSLGSFYININDAIVGIPVKINSSGYSVIMTPDGKIANPNGEGFYNALREGTYSAIGYQHSGRAFSASLFESFKSSMPKVSMNTTCSVINSTALINVTLTNLDPILHNNLTTVISILNSTGASIFSKGEFFSLDIAESKNFKYYVDLKEADIFTATATLSVGFLEIIEEKSFPIKMGVETVEDVAILSLGYKKEYSPHDDVAINLTVQSYAPDLAFNISIPALNYKRPIVVTGTQSINLTLPKMLPDYYIIGIGAEKNGKILDSRIIGFYIRADGVGLLTFNTSKILYNAGELEAINLSLKDLNLTKVDSQVGVTVRYPAGITDDFAANKTSDGYQFDFLPATNGTYMLEAHASKEGWRIDNNTFTVIVDQMSPLNMSVTMGEYILANVTANGQPAACIVTLYTPQGNESVITSNGLALFNATNQFYIVADKMFFEPAFYSFEPHGISGTKFNDSNSNATRDPGETGLPAWTIRLTRPDGTTINATTDANGSYKFENLTSGTYRVSEIRQSNWTQTYPAWLGDHIINVTDGNVTGVDFGNNYLPAPEIPFPPSGPASGIPGAEYSYTTSSTDPSGYQIAYTFDWGDGSNFTTGLFDSGAVASADHIWNGSGVYQVRAMATNSKGASSGWSAALEVDIAAGIIPDQIGVFRNGGLYFDANGDRYWTAGDTMGWFGTTGDLPVAGDWDGDGKDEIAVFRNGGWYFDANGDGYWSAGDTTGWFGATGDLPAAGDWDGDGKDEIAVFRNGGWYFDANGDGYWTEGDTTGWFGATGDLPAAGDWDGDGKDEISVFRNGGWYFDANGDRYWTTGDTTGWFGATGDLPAAVDWDNNGEDEIAVFRNGGWYFDANGDGYWTTGDTTGWFGATGDLPVAGRWGSSLSAQGMDHYNPQLDLKKQSAEEIRQKRAAVEEIKEESRDQVREIKLRAATPP